MQFIFVYLQSISFYFIVAADHITINVIKANWAELIFVFFIILLVVALFMKDMRTVITDHPLVDCYWVITTITYQIANMPMILNRSTLTIVCIIFRHVYIYCD